MPRCATRGRGLLCFRTTACLFATVELSLCASHYVESETRHNQSSQCGLFCFLTIIFTSACIQLAMQALVQPEQRCPSVRPSVSHTPVLYQNEEMGRRSCFRRTLFGNLQSYAYRPTVSGNKKNQPSDCTGDISVMGLFTGGSQRVGLSVKPMNCIHTHSSHTCRSLSLLSVENK